MAKLYYTWSQYKKYEPLEYSEYPQGFVYICIQTTNLGESPVSAPLKWKLAFGSSFPGTVSSITATLPIAVSPDPITTTGTVTSSMATNKLIGRYTAGTGVMQEITIGSGLTLSGGGTLSASIGSIGWLLDGNTVGSEKWIGTIDNFDFPIRTNNVQIAEFSAAGNFGIGVAPNAAYRLHSKGSGTVSATYSLFAENSGSTQSLGFRDDGIIIRNGAVYSVEDGSFARENTSWGHNSLASATGTENAAFGFQALLSVVGGVRLTAMGNNAAVSNVSGSQGSYFGFKAGGLHTSDGASVFGEFSAYHATTASYMTAVGHRTMVDSSVTVGITGGSYVTALGAGAGQRGTSASVSNSTYLGSRTISEGSNEVVIGGIGNTDFYFGTGRFGTAGSSTLYGITMHPTSPASGSTFYGNQTDANGINWTFAVSQATGSGTSGDMIWQYAPSGSTGTTLTTATTGMTFKGTTGQLQFSTIGAIFNPYGVSSGNTGELRFAELAAGGTNYVGFKAADAIGTTVIWTLPDSDSTGTQALVSNGSGVLSWASIGGGGTVTSVSGTANRITSTGGATPVIDISASYVGQTSITTLGTVTTGTLSTGAIIGGVTMTLGSDATGDIYYRNAGGVLTRLAIGSNTDILTVTAGLPSWTTAPTAGANTALSNLASVAINTTLLPGSNDGAALGSGTLSFSDLFLASGGLINFANGNSVITHSSAVLTVSTGDLRVTTAGTNAASVATLDGTQTLTNKTITASTNVLGTVTMTLGSDATGDVYYRSGGSLLTRLAIGSTGDSLTVVSGIPAWSPKGYDLTSQTANGVTVGSGATVYAAPFFGGSFNATEGNRQLTIKVAGTVGNLYVRTNSAQSGLGSLVITVRKNGADTAVTLTIAAGSAAATFSDVANTVAFAAGDLIGFKVVNNAAATSANIMEVGVFVK